MTSRTLVAATVVFALALVVRVLYVREHYQVLDLDISRLTQTDNHTFAEWARHIAEGDVLCRDQVHAFHLWTRKVAPEEMWNEWYGSTKVFHQSPLYPYFIALVYETVGYDPARVGYVQALLGALTCVLTFVLVRRTVSFRAGVIAGLLLALYAGYYFYDAFLLRDGFMAFITVVLALALERAVSRGLTRDWILAGAALGLCTLAKETGFALLILTVVLAFWWRRRQPRLALRTCGLVLAGWFVAMSPAIARNLVLGVPPLKLSTRGPEVFVAGNAKGQDGVSWNPPSDVMREILRKSDFSLPKTVLYTLATHRADPLGYLELLWDKTTAYFNGYEPPNNVDFDLHRAHLDTLKWPFVPRIDLLHWQIGDFKVDLGSFTIKPLPVSMAFLGPAALLGLLLAIPRRRRLAVPYLLFFALVLSVVALYVIARFRLQAMPLIVLFAAITVDWTLTAVSRRRWLQLAVMAVPFLILDAWCRDEQSFFNDASKNFAVMFKHVKTGNYEKAREFRDAQLRLFDQYETLKYDDSVIWKVRDLKDAFAAFDRSLTYSESSAERHLYTGLGYTNLLRVAGRHESEELAALALDEFERALDISPTLRGVYRGMGQLFERRDDRNQALNCYEQEIDLHPDDAPSLREYGMILLQREKRVPALTYLERAVRAGDDDPLTNVRIAQMLVDSSLGYRELVLPDGQILETYNPKLAETRARTAIAGAGYDPEVLKCAARVLYQIGVIHGPITLVDDAIAVLERILEVQRGGVDPETGLAIWEDPAIQRFCDAVKTYRAEHDAPSGAYEDLNVGGARK